MHADLLIEIGTEELPPSALNGLSQHLSTKFTQLIQEQGLSFDTCQAFASPRRLGLKLLALQTQQPSRTQTRRGPAIAQAFNAQQQPTQAALGFARSCGVAIEALETLKTDKGEWLAFTQTVSGTQAAALIPKLLHTTLKQLPIPKPMRWGTGAYQFVRPCHWLIVMLGDKVIPMELFGISSGNQTCGHRFLTQQALAIEQADQYPARLQKSGFVQPDWQLRRQDIARQATALAEQVGGIALLDDTLLDVVTGLVEWPVAYVGKFDPNFLGLPKECLISAMQSHQKCFPIVQADQQLLPYFIITSNLETQDPTSIIAGNERVMQARLKDAAFLYDTDKRQPLSTYAKQLTHIVFQNKLGSIADKVSRMQALAAEVAPCLNTEPGDQSRAIALCKADLVTQMVYEFPELQGIMGGYYARLHGEPAAVAQAIEEHYKPCFAQDSLPTSPLGILVALCDRLDTLVGLFAIGKIPSGDKDPFALRRQALAVLRIIIEHKLVLPLTPCFEAHSKRLDGLSLPTQTLLDFFKERLRAWYLAQDYSPQAIKAVFATGVDDMYDLHCRLQAVVQFQTLSEACALSAADKRVRNLLSKVTDTAPHLTVDKQRLQAPAEIELYASITQLEPAIAANLQQHNYTAVLTQLAGLRTPIDSFFDQVRVLDGTPEMQNNRLALLKRLHNLFTQVAVLSEL